MLGVAVHVEGAKFGEVCVFIVHSLRAIAVGCGGGGVDKTDMVIIGPLS